MSQVDNRSLAAKLREVSGLGDGNMRAHADVIRQWTAEAATRLEALQAQPVGEDALRRARQICADHDSNKAYQYLEGQRDDYMPMTAVVAALTASPPVVEREALREIINRRVCGFVGEYENDREELIDTILALTPVEGVGEAEAAFNAGWAEAVQCIENEGPMAADHMARDTTWEAYRAALSTPVAQGDEVRDALELAYGLLWHMSIDIRDPSLKLASEARQVLLSVMNEDAQYRGIQQVRTDGATLTKGARDAG